MRRSTLTGWGRTGSTGATTSACPDEEAVIAAVRSAGPRGVLARGGGRAYGDAAQNGGGHVVRQTDGKIGPIRTDGRITVDASATLGRLIDAVAPAGWFPAALPGTAHVSVGGAIASDVHGKDHAAGGGSFGAHVESLRLVDGTGTVRTLGPDCEPDLFWATVGGMGLTGIVTAAELRLRRVDSAAITARTQRTHDLDGALALLADDEHFPYAAAWIDTLARGRQFGRAVVTRGTHAPCDDSGRRPPLTDRPAHLRVPRLVPGGLLNLTTARAFNELWFHRAPRDGVATQSARSFLFPLDGIADWNRLYGRPGLVQYQFVVPEPGDLERVLGRIAAERTPGFLAVLKRMGDESPAPLSFPRPGWSLAVDIPAATPGLANLLDELDGVVATAGGRVYLTKDARLRPDVLPAMYPRLPAWRTARAALDPAGHFQSDLGRRLGLGADPTPPATMTKGSR